jgi:glycosyltransferase involved in cell wall biosynthesis
MAIRVLPTVRHKYFDTVVHTAFSVMDLVPRRFDVVLICNAANAPFALIAALSGAKVVLNVDGLEWQRKKWGIVGRTYYRLCSWLAPRLPAVLVSDARVVADFYRTRRGSRTVYIPYGASPSITLPGNTLDQLGLSPDGYLLYVSRLEPENNADLVLEAYRAAGGKLRLQVPLVIVGDAPYATDYKASLQAIAAETPGVIMTGYLFGEAYAELQSNCALYIQATEVGGTHPALVEAMARAACIVAQDVPEHREVLADAGVYFDRASATSLAGRLKELLSDPERRRELGRRAQRRATDEYSWDHVTDEYETLFAGMFLRR